MQRLMSLMVLATSLLTTSVGPALAQIRINEGVQPVDPRLVEPLRRVRPHRDLTCPDPAVQAIHFNLLHRTTRFRGRVRVTGIVRNQGTAAFQSTPNQQIVALYEHVPGGRPRLVAQRPFQNLAPGEEVQVIFERDWYSASPAEGEFPPTYLVTITYDPDIYIDGNPHNDDCRTGNNRMERSGAEINAMF